MQEFFLVALPGLEDLVLAEVKEWCPELDAAPVHGGVTVMASLAAGLALNTVLKTPTRILLRVARFRCRDFPKLYKKTFGVDWKAIVDPACELNVSASSRVSRLKIKKRIKETCEDAWVDYRKSQRITQKRDKKLRLFVRFVNDECTLSLDTSGERLHKRGEREWIGEAPLRETIAAALIQNCGRTAPHDQPVEVVDPMMGSGTFLLESAQRDIGVSSREFAFENFAGGVTEDLKLRAERPQIVSLVGYESDAKTMSAAETNLAHASDRGRLRLVAKDFFAAEPLAPTENARWVFCNPPYGERLKIDGPRKDYYEKLFAAVERVAKPDRACFLLPSDAVKGKFVLPWGWKVAEKRPFLNGGIPVIAFLFARELS